MIFNLLDAAWPGHAEPAPTELVLYNAGNECSSVTGGWSAYAPVYGGNTAVRLKNASDEWNPAVNTANPAGNGTIPSSWQKRVGDLLIQFKVPDSSGGYVNTALGTTRLLNLADYSTLHIQAVVNEEGVPGNHYAKFGVTAVKSPVTTSTPLPPPNPSGNSVDITTGETTLDISGVSSGYVFVCGMNGATTGIYTPKETEIKVSRIWLT